MRKTYIAFLLIIISLSLIVAFAGCSSVPTNNIVNIDYSISEGDIKYGATGWLYGLAEENVPSSNLLLGLQPKIAAVKAPDGTQHPIGDVLNVADTFLSNGGEYLFIYMQDIYPDWYYIYQGQEDYIEKIRQMMPKLVNTTYCDKIYYCPFNESDNGEWYGDFKKSESRQKFYLDWLSIYNVIKEYDKNAKIAGPGFMRYNGKYIKEFLSFCKDNNCIPEMMVWHELSSKSYYQFELNYEDYRKIETDLSISELVICISEYGEMIDNGIPGKMLQYISMYESKKVYACIAFWRLANNLSELASDNNTPTPAWWIYNWYGEMKGDTYLSKNDNEKNSAFRAITSYNKETKEITIISGGGNKNSTINLNNINSLWGLENTKELYVNIEYVEFKGLGAECLIPTPHSAYKIPVDNGNAKIEFNDDRDDIAYKITLSTTPYKEYINKNKAIRYEAEDATITGMSTSEKKNSIVKDNRYASSGKLIKNVDSENKSLNFTINAPKSGNYTIDIVYSNEYTSESTKDSRTNSIGKVTIDNDISLDIVYKNTISSTMTSCVSIQTSLTQGTHLLSFKCLYGSVTYDFIDLTYTPNDTLNYLPTILNNGKYMFVVPESGYYKLNSDTLCTITFNSVSTSSQNVVIYMEKGINYIILDKKSNISLTKIEKDYVSYSVTTYGDFSDLKQIRGKDNYIQIDVNVLSEGYYAIDIPYSNNAQSGNHDYNVELVERYACIETNGINETVFFRNTYSWDSISYRTIYVYFNYGNNIIKIYNNNSHMPDTQASYLPYINYDLIKIACLFS